MIPEGIIHSREKFIAYVVNIFAFRPFNHENICSIQELIDEFNERNKHQKDDLNIQEIIYKK